MVSLWGPTTTRRGVTSGGPRRVWVGGWRPLKLDYHQFMRKCLCLKQYSERTELKRLPKGDRNLVPGVTTGIGGLWLTRTDDGRGKARWGQRTVDQTREPLCRLRSHRPPNVCVRELGKWVSGVNSVKDSKTCRFRNFQYIKV